MMRITTVVGLFADLGEAEVVRWVHCGWVRPVGEEADWQFQDIDVARIRLIRDLRRMGLNDESIPLVLSLLDQVYDLRGQMHALMRAVEAQPEPVRAAILRGIRG